MSFLWSGSSHTHADRYLSTYICIVCVYLCVSGYPNLFEIGYPNLFEIIYEDNDTLHKLLCLFIFDATLELEDTSRQAEGGLPQAKRTLRHLASSEFDTSKTGLV